MQDFVANSSRWRIALMILGCAGFVAIGLWMIGAVGDLPSLRRLPSAVRLGIGWLGIIFFGFCGVSWIKRLSSGGEELRIDSVGIRWVRWSEQTIPWLEIGDVTTWSYKGQKSIILRLRNPARFPGRGFLGWTGKANRALTGGDIALSLASTDRSFDEAMTAIERFRPRSP
jgi:hypothetical protein